MKICFLSIVFLSLFIQTFGADFEKDSSAQRYPVMSEYSYKIDSIERYPGINIFQVANLFPSFIINQDNGKNFDNSNIMTGFNNTVIVRGIQQNNFLQINNINVSDPIYGGLGPVDPSQSPLPSIYAYENIELTPSEFSASNYNNLGSVLQMNLKKGNPHKYEAFAYYTGTITGLYGSTKNDYNVNVVNQALVVNETSNRRKYNSSGDRSIDIGIGGPLLFDDKSSFFISYRNYYRGYNAGLNNYDPAGNDLGKLPNQRTFINNFTGSLNFKVLDDINVELSGMYGISSWESSSWDWLYATTSGLYNNIPEREAKQPAQNYVNSFINLSISNKLSENFTYKFSFGISNNKYESGRKNSFGEPDVINGFDIKKPEDKYSIYDSTYFNEYNGLIDIYESGFVHTTTSDGFLNIYKPSINPITGYYEFFNESNKLSGTNNPYGLPYYFNSTGNSPLMISFLDALKYTASFEIGNKYTQNNICYETKFGANFSIYSYDKYIALLNNSDPSYCVNSEKYQTGLFLEFGDNINQKYLQPIKPYFGGAYFEEIVHLKQFILDIGVRSEYFNNNYDLDYYPLYFNKENKTFHFSPRFNISYKINESNDISIGYGSFFMMQDFNSSLSFCYKPFSSNPSILPANNDILQLTYSGTSLYDIKINSSVFINRLRNMPELAYSSIITSYTIITYSGKNDNYGFELSANKRIFDDFNLTTNYNLLYSDIPNSKNNISQTLHLIFNYGLGMGRGIDLLGFQPFENLNLTLVSSMKSGAHYTETDLNGKPIGEFNALKFPDQTNFDFRLSKKLFFSHSNIPGEINPYITFSIDVFNIFNSSYLFYNDLQKGIIPLRKPGDFTSVTYYKKAEVGNPETFMPAQYDALGNRLYNKAADFNSDGMVTPDETFRAYSIYAQNYLRFQNDMTSLRSVFFNVSVGF